MHSTPYRATSARSGSANSPSEERLLAGFGQGDPGAAKTFVRRYQGRVYGLAQSITGNPAQAEEVAQEALIRAWRQANSYDPRRGSVTTWVLTITRNLAVDTLRRTEAQPVDLQATIFLDQSTHSSMPEDAASVTDETDRVRTALSHLPSEQRRALLLAAFYGCTAREISEREAIPLGTAKARVRRGLTKVRSVLHLDETTVGPQSTHTTVAYSSRRQSINQ
jgi:RNA polymerase sigma factor (sigma-70 family)